MRVYKNLFHQIISTENLFLAWDEFKRGKGKKLDVLHFERNLEQHIFQLHRNLRDHTYRHGRYTGFYISDPKLRHIHKAAVRDRVLHHAIFKVLNYVFEPTFIPTSFSCRLGKGTHKGVQGVAGMLRKESRNNTRPCFVLKCDIKKFFDSVDHHILMGILKRKLDDVPLLQLLEEVVSSFAGESSNLFDRKGLPIGNLTSQLFANVYMNEFDQFMKRKLGVRRYARYTDDFIVVSSDKGYLESLLTPVEKFLSEKLKLGLHPEKTSIRKHTEGIDFLGYVVFPHHVLLRKRTQQRAMRKLKGKITQHKAGAISKEVLDQTLQSYLGILSHADAHHMSRDLQNSYWFWINE